MQTRVPTRKLSDASLQSWCYLFHKGSIVPDSHTTDVVCRIPYFSNRRTPVGKAVVFASSRGVLTCTVLWEGKSSKFNINILRGLDFITHHLPQTNVGCHPSKSMTEQWNHLQAAKSLQKSQCSSMFSNSGVSLCTDNEPMYISASGIHVAHASPTPTLRSSHQYESHLQNEIHCVVQGELAFRESLCF